MKKIEVKVLYNRQLVGGLNLRKEIVGLGKKIHNVAETLMIHLSNDYQPSHKIPLVNVSKY